MLNDFFLPKLQTLILEWQCTQVKWPDGKIFEDKFVEILKKYGYQGSYLSKNWMNQPVFIQSFAPTSIIHISNLTDLPKILLIDDTTIPTQDTNQVLETFPKSMFLKFVDVSGFWCYKCYVVLAKYQVRVLL